jgi:hypothetical protein
VILGFGDFGSANVESARGSAREEKSPNHKIPKSPNQMKITVYSGAH